MKLTTIVQIALIYYVLTAVSCDFGAMHNFAHTPHRGQRDADAKRYIDNFLKNSDAKYRFSVYYNLDDATFRNISVVEPSTFAVRIFDGYETVTGGATVDLSKPHFIVYPLFPSGEDSGYSLPIPQASVKAVLTSDTKDINAVDDGSDPSKLHPPLALAESANLETGRQWVRNYYAQIKLGFDRYPSLMFRLSDYEQVKAMKDVVNVRVYHGLIGQKRVVILVGLDKDAKPMFDENLVVNDANSLCPYECDLF